MTTDLTAYQPRIDALCRETGNRVSVQLEMWYATGRAPKAEWQVYISGVPSANGLFQAATLEGALAQAEYAWDLAPAEGPLGVVVTP